jgi:hypothetical protein
MMEKVDRRHRRQSTDQGRQGHEPQVVLRNDAVVDGQHDQPLHPILCTRLSAPAVLERKPFGNVCIEKQQYRALTGMAGRHHAFGPIVDNRCQSAMERGASPLRPESGIALASQ